MTQNINSAEYKNSDTSAVRYSFWLRAWQGISIFITIPLLLSKLDGNSQGLYYFFLTVSSTQAFFEMGLGLILTIRASHEWINLRISLDGSVDGKEEARARLKQLCIISLKFTFVAAISFLTISIVVGTQFFDGADVVGGWQKKFVIYTIVISCIMVFNSLVYVVEGCNQVGAVAVFRLIQSIIGSFTLWLSLQLGYGIDSLVFQGLSTLLCLATYILFFRRKFFISLYLCKAKSLLSWKNDFLPHQWRLAMQSIFNLLVFPFFQLLAFKMLGPIESGKLGLTLQIALGIQGLSLVFISAKIPHLSMLAARGLVSQQKNEWKIQIAKSTGFMCTFFLIYIVGLTIVANYFEMYYIRVLDIRETVIFFAGLIATPYIYGVACLTRAHKIEKFTLIGVLSGLGCSASSVILCFYLGGKGIAIAYTAMTLLVVLPLSYRVMKIFINEHMIDSSMFNQYQVKN